MRVTIRAISSLAIASTLLAAAAPAQAIDNTNNCTTITYAITGTADLSVVACVAFSNNGSNVQYKAWANQVQHPGVPFIADQFSMFTVLGQLRYNGSNLRTSCTSPDSPSQASQSIIVSCEGAWPRGTVVTWAAWGAVRYTDSTGTHYGDVEGHVAKSPGITG